MKEERIQFKKELRQKVLKDCGNKCCACGKLLSMKTMTIDHVVPISRGGENTEDNLVSLCEDCNRLKGNQLQFPSSYFEYLNGDNKKRKAVLDYFYKWIKENLTIADIREYPMIVKSLCFVAETEYKQSGRKFTTSTVYEMLELNEKQVRDCLHKNGMSIVDYMNAVEFESSVYSIIGLRRRGSDDFLSMYSVQLLSTSFKSVTEKYGIELDEYVKNGALGVKVTEIYNITPTVSSFIPVILFKNIVFIWCHYMIDIVPIEFKTSDNYKMTKLYLEHLNVEHYLDGEISYRGKMDNGLYTIEFIHNDLMDAYIRMDKLITGDE